MKIKLKEIVALKKEWKQLIDILQLSKAKL